MARPFRIELPGGFYHVMARGNEGKRIFRGVRDRDRFLSLLDDAHVRYRTLVYVYALMNDHYHLLIETEKANLSKAIHYLNVSHSVYLNRRYGRSGHLFQGRYKSVLVDKEPYLLELSRYLHINVVRAGVEDRLNDPRWTSYRYYVGASDKPDWLCTDWLIDRLGGDWPTVRRKYQEFVMDGLRSEIRSPFQDVYRGAILGDEVFVEKMKKRLEEEIGEDHEVPGYKSLSRWYAIEDIVGTVCEHFALTPGELKKRRWGFLPRKVAMYLARKYTDSTLREIGDYFDVSYSAISQNVDRVANSPSARKVIDEIERRLEMGPI